MGIYDRDYIHEEEPRRWSGGRSMVINLILINVVIYVADLLFEQRISEALSLKSELLQKPWLCWQLVTYGFIHDPQSILHILFNMYFLWMFGTDVETIYGKAEFLRIYLCAIVVAGLAWLAISALPAMAEGRQSELVGASGGVMGIMILWVLHFPRRLIYFFGVLPVPAWAMGAIFVVGDLMGVGNGSESGRTVANVAHLGGVAFGFIYYRTGLNLGRLVPRRLSAGAFRWRPKLRIHDPDDVGSDLNQQVDRILEKISQQGEASLTKSERRTLEEASRRYQRRRQ